MAETPTTAEWSPKERFTTLGGGVIEAAEAADQSETLSARAIDEPHEVFGFAD